MINPVALFPNRVHRLDAKGNKLSDNSIFTDKAGSFYALIGNGTCSKKAIQTKCLFVRSDGKLIWKLSTEMTPVTQ